MLGIDVNCNCWLSNTGYTISINAPFWNMEDSKKIKIINSLRNNLYVLEDLTVFFNIFPCPNHMTMQDASQYVSIEQLKNIISSELLDTLYSPEDCIELRNTAQAYIVIISNREQREKFLSGTRRTPDSSLRTQVIERDNSTCRYCGISLTKKEVYIDHIYPYYLGGLTEITNLVVSCFSCNSKKAGKTLDQTIMKLLEIAK